MITFQNKCPIDLSALTTFGVCVKPATTNPIGYFGTGLKYALAVLLREKQKVTMYHGEMRCTFDTKERNVRGQPFSVVRMNGADLPFTIDLGKNWDLWMAYRELYANMIDEDDAIVADGELPPHTECTTFVVEGDAFEAIYKQHNTIFLGSSPAYELEGLEIHDDPDAGGWLYYKGIRVYKLAKRAMYNYNITSDLKLTEDRTISTLSDAYIAIAKGIAKCDQPALIRQLLQADQRHFESTIDYHWWSVKPGEVFNQIVARYISSGTSFSSSARELYRRDHPEDELPNVIQMETIPMEQRRKLWAALMFWGKLGISIPKALIHVTDGLGQKKGKAISGHIYLSKFVLEMDMRYITGLVYKLYADTKPEIGKVKVEDLLIDT
ncbi:hypothetical protein LCGC14_2691700, partial [marine sediment metagenome]